MLEMRYDYVVLLEMSPSLYWSIENMTNYRSGSAPISASAPLIELRPLMRLVYLWMGLGLLTTAIIAFFVANNEALLITAANAMLPLILVQLGLVIGLSWAINKISPSVATILFFVYAASMGLTMGVILYSFAATEGGAMAIASAFFTTAGLFGAMTVVGFTTKVDLSRFSTYFMMALIGLVIAMFVNMLLQSTFLGYVISVVGVLVFTALTAYDTQKIKEMSMAPEMQEHSDSMVRLSIIGALTLYLDFINLFLFLLRIFGGGGRD